MTQTIRLNKKITSINLEAGTRISIPNISFAEYEEILNDIGNKRSARLIYSQRTLQIVVPLPEHERPKELISDVVKLLLRKKKINFEPFGSSTFKEPKWAGVEPDACFYIQNYQQMINRRRFLPGDPPPDLAIESDLTSQTAIAAYEAIKVPELWIYDDGILTIYLLQDGKYIASNISPTFPDLDLGKLIPETIEKSYTIGSNRALEELSDIC